MYLIFDLDDTLLTTDKKITKYTKSVLRTCQRRGHLIVINSARPFSKIKEVIKDIEVDYVIANGGSEIYNGEILKFAHKDKPLAQGTVAEQKQSSGLDAPAIAQRIEETLKKVRNNG